MKASLLVGSIFLIICVGALSLPALSQAPAPQPTPMGAFYYAWYGYNATADAWTGGWNTSHWTWADGIVGRPALGYYSSMNDSVIAWQLDEMQSQHIVFLIVSWWGLEDYNTQSLLHLFQYVNDTGSDMRLSVMIEPHSNLNIESELSFVASLYAEYPEVVFNWQGKPLLCAFNPVVLPVDNRFTLRTVGQMPYVDWHYWRGMQGLVSFGGSWNMTAVSSYVGDPVVARDGEVSVIPRFDSSALYMAGSRSHFMVFGPVWQQELEFAQVHARLIVVTSWNEYSESTEIEPHLVDGGV